MAVPSPTVCSADGPPSPARGRGQVGISLREIHADASSGDRGLWLLSAGAAAVPAALLVLMFGFLLIEAWPGLTGGSVLRFAGAAWYPLEDRFGLAAIAVSTLAVTALALSIAVPLGLGCAVCLVFFAPPAFAGTLRAVLALLAGIPSVVYGFWGLTTLVPLVNAWHPPGASLATAGIILALMILPTVALIAAAALGLGRRASVLRVALPAARRGVLGGVLLAVLRALGETMAVLMVAGNVVNWPRQLSEPVRTLTANLALEMGYAYGPHRAALFVSALLLAGLVLVVAMIASRAEAGHGDA